MDGQNPSVGDQNVSVDGQNPSVDDQNGVSVGAELSIRFRVTKNVLVCTGP